MQEALIQDIMFEKGFPWLVGIFILLFVMEGISGLRARKQKRSQRIIINFLVSIPGFLSLRFLLLPVLVWVAIRNQEWRAGLNYLYDLPPLAEGIIAFLLLDYTNYLWHILNHKFPLLWRFHLVHHTDIDLDVTTALRFHAGEMITSVVYRGFFVFAIGVSPEMVLMYEIFFEAATQFHHSNWRLPFALEKILHFIIVTPRMHGVHHSVIKNETDSNYAVIFSWWDRLHGTLRLGIPHRQITIGVPVYHDPKELNAVFLLKLPFTRIRRWIDGMTRNNRRDNRLLP